MCEEGLRVVKHFQQGGRLTPNTGEYLTLPAEEAPANFVPAAAVIRKGQALFGLIWCKGFVGCNKVV